MTYDLFLSIHIATWIANHAPHLTMLDGSKHDDCVDVVVALVGNVKW